MNNFPSQGPESKVVAPDATKPVADAKPRSSASAVVKAKVTARAPKASAPAKLAPGQPVEKVPAAASKPVAKVKAPPIARPAAKPVSAAVPAGKVRSPAKRVAKAGKTASEVRVPAESQAKPLSAEKKSKETKHAGKKPKLVRDSFTFPAADYALIGALKQRALKAGQEIKKSELLRAGLFALSALSDAALVKALGGIDRLKPGRPAK